MTIRSLIIAPHWIGDAVMTEPLLRQLNARGEELTVAAVSWVAPIFDAMPQVKEVLVLPFVHGKIQFGARQGIARQIAGRFDKAYILPNSFKSALVPFMAKIKERIGYVGEMRYRLVSKAIKNESKKNRVPIVDHYNALAGADANLCGHHPALAVDANIIAATLAAFELEEKKFVILVPGAEYGPAKRWPAKHYASFALELDPKTPIVLLGSHKDRNLCNDIVSMINAHQSQLECLNFAGRCSLSQSIALIASCRLVVGNDSGLMHVTAALDVPQIAIFGSSSPLYTPPLSDKARLIWLKDDETYRPSLDCAPCFKKTCPLGHTRCLYDIEPERVFEQFQKISGESSGAVI